MFSGIGGFELGLELAGLGPVVWQCESDLYCREILQARWPGCQLYTDVTTLRGAKLPYVDVICGGFPCQDISFAGSGAGLAGDRSGLWFSMLEVIRATRPKICCRGKRRSSPTAGARRRPPGPCLMRV